LKELDDFELHVKQGLNWKQTFSKQILLQVPITNLIEIRSEVLSNLGNLQALSLSVQLAC
jgi:hypothetical protein